MEDPILNRNLEETKELQARWTQFRDFYLMAARGQQQVTAQAEMKFLELKSRIAMLHDSFMSGLTHDQKTGMNIMSIVGDCILLARVTAASDAEKQKFEFDWNECYLLLTDQVGALEQEKERLAGINERVYNAGKRKEALAAKIHNFLHSAGLKYSLIALAIFFVVYGIPALGIYNYRELGGISFTRPVYLFISNEIYRPFLSPEYEYTDQQDIQFIDVKSKIPGSITTEANNLDAKFLKDTELPSMGLTPESREKIATLVDANQWMQTERWKAEGSDVRHYAILFDSSANARQFVEAIKEAHGKLTPEQKKAVTDQTYLQRRANLVVLGRGNHIHRQTYLQETYHFVDLPTLLM